MRKLIFNQINPLPGGVIMNQKGQSALEYLMTYGWALIVIAVVIGVLLFVTSSSTGGVTCQSRGSQMILKESPVIVGTNGVGLVLQNATGGTISSIEATSGGDFAAASVAVSGTVTSGGNIVVQNLSGPAAAGTFSNGTVNINYTTAGGLDANVTVVCSGSL